MQNPVPFHHWLRLLRSPSPAACPPSPAPSFAPPPDAPVSLWAQTALGFSPDPLQTRILDSPSSRLILLCCRQFGKSTLAALKALHFALSHPNSTILCVSPTLRRSTEWLRLVRHFFSILSTHGPHPPLTPAAPLARATSVSLSLPNASRILALPGAASSNRGYTAHLLLFEEAAFIPDPVFAALTPSLAATNGALWLISSAGAPSGFFYEIWSNPGHPFTRFSATAGQCPRISPHHLIEARLALGELRFRREYLCHFTTGEASLFSPEILESALDDSFDPWTLEAA